PADLRRFRDYLRALTEHDGPGEPDLSAFADFSQFPRYGATFAQNARAVAEERAARPPQRGDAPGFERLAVLDVGLNPHQIAFSADGRTAYVAAAGSDQVAVVDVATRTLARTIPVRGTPLAAVPLPGGTSLAVTRFGGEEIARYRISDGAELGALRTGGAPSLLTPIGEGRFLVSVERTDRVHVFDARTFDLAHTYATGRRPFPAAATTDGRLAFVPAYDDGTVTVVDLWNDTVVARVEVGERPSGGAVLPGDLEYAVAVRGEDRIAFVNTASKEVVGSLSEGIGASPFSVVVAPDGRLAFVNNTASHDVSVIALPEKRVIARLPVGAQPIVMAVHPSGATLWVSSEGSHELTVFRIPERWRAARDGGSPALPAGV
ncbi:MAG: hypothetical protein D6701_04795, partial [Gemmatimonadetes bacterium]